MLGNRVHVLSRDPGRLKTGLGEWSYSIGGSALNDLATIVHPGTIRRWIREAASKKSARQKPKSGRPRTSQEIEKLILKLAKDNGWGYFRREVRDIVAASPMLGCLESCFAIELGIPTPSVKMDLQTFVLSNIHFQRDK